MVYVVYDIELSLGGSSNFGNRGVDRDSGRNVDAILGDASPADFSDTIGKLNLQYQVNDNVMLYGTMSEGFRAGGFNRNGGASLVAGVGPFVPDFFGSDELNNLEFGWKPTYLTTSYALTVRLTSLSGMEFKFKHLISTYQT